MTSRDSSGRSDIRGGLLWVALGALIVGESLRMERFESMGATVYTYPGFVPGILGLVVSLLGLLLLARGWHDAQASGTAEGPVITPRVVIALSCCLLFCLVLLTRIHFALATAVFVSVFTFLFMDPAGGRRRRLLVSTGNGVITATLVFYVFQEIFLVRLP